MQISERFDSITAIKHCRWNGWGKLQRGKWKLPYINWSTMKYVKQTFNICLGNILAETIIQRWTLHPIETFDASNPFWLNPSANRIANCKYC